MVFQTVLPVEQLTPDFPATHPRRHAPVILHSPNEQYSEQSERNEKQVNELRTT